MCAHCSLALTLDRTSLHLISFIVTDGANATQPRLYWPNITPAAEPHFLMPFIWVAGSSTALCSALPGSTRRPSYCSFETSIFQIDGNSLFSVQDAFKHKRMPGCVLLANLHQLCHRQGITYCIHCFVLLLFIWWVFSCCRPGIHCWELRFCLQISTWNNALLLLLLLLLLMYCLVNILCNLPTSCCILLYRLWTLLIYSNGPCGQHPCLVVSRCSQLVIVIIATPETFTACTGRTSLNYQLSIFISALYFFFLSLGTLLCPFNIVRARTAGLASSIIYVFLH